SLLISDLTHEELSLLIMEMINLDFNGRLSMAIEIFRGNHPKRFLHQLVSSQLDMDRLDYLNRDSFFTGVAEGVIGYDRIIKMLSVRNNELVVESKGIYSIEKFLISRRLMYWQVYLHKTVLSAEQLLVKIIKRAKEISKGRKILSAPALSYFLESNFEKKDLQSNEEMVPRFADLDDTDVITSIKMWRSDEDFILSWLSTHLLERKLYRIELRNSPFSRQDILEKKHLLKNLATINDADLHYFIFTDSTSNHAYSPLSGKINILFKDDSMKDIAEASDLLNIRVLEDPVVKYYLCSPKEVG
ncbi:MAG: phosphohydrolase, partial [Chitinophagales bacterium]|nr:phosphohydrolase [Chitinophagales bacterium]